MLVKVTGEDMAEHKVVCRWVGLRCKAIDSICYGLDISVGDTKSSVSLVCFEGTESIIRLRFIVVSGDDRYISVSGGGGYFFEGENRIEDAIDYIVCKVKDYLWGD
jgi:hypothetical protein